VKRVVALLLLAVLVAGCGGGDRPDPTAAFLDRYVASDGRVVRHDQGGDTVSEGQSYALLLTALDGDETRFDRVWGWTRSHLQRRDGLLAWHWRDGRVVDWQPASDADLDTARALVVAARRFGRPELRIEAKRISGAILREETSGGALLAGPWASATGTINPSYASPAAASTLAGLGDRAAWLSVRADGIATVRELTKDGNQLPPDWAVGASASGPPGDPGAAPTYGYDAVRVPIRLAETCDPAAARLWPLLRRGDPAILPRTADSHGTSGASRNAVALVGAAAAAHAAGNDTQRDHLMAAAQALDAEHPTYYGAAWIALGTALLARPC
jgi:endoglucanase